MMATNRAQMELQSLLDASQETVNAGDALARLDETRRPPATSRPVDPDDEAAFAKPEALATAIGAAFILGPVGGLLLGAAQGLLGKREQQGVLDRMRDERNALTQADDIFNDELDRLAMVTDDPLDHDQLNSMRANKDAATRMMMSASPALQQQGAALMSKFNDTLQAYTERQETQAIAADTEDARIRRELDDTQYSRYDSSITSFRNESEGYLKVMEATDTAMNALGSGSPADLWAAGILINKALDPGSIVRPDEAKAIGMLGSLWDKAGTILESAKSGQTILPAQRRELTQLLGTIRSTVTKHQLAREAAYSDEVIDIGLPDKYHDNFRLVKNVPAANAPAIEGDANAATAIDGIMPDAITAPVTDAIEAVVPTPGDQDRGSFLERMGLLPRNARGNRVQTQRGVTYERIKYPDGRFEWVPQPKQAADELPTNDR